VRNDLLNSKVEAVNEEQAYSPSLYRESRDEQGELTFIAADDRLKLIEGLPVLNVETDTMEAL
jgi:hypothetical protein